MILSVDDLDDFHESFMMKLEHDRFHNILLPSDVQEIKQAIEQRKQQWQQVEQVFYNYLQGMSPDDMDYIPFQAVYNHVRNRQKRQIQTVVHHHNETHFTDLIEQLWTKGWTQVPKDP